MAGMDFTEHKTAATRGISLIQIVVVTWAVYVFSLVVFRLKLSPVAHVPGPWLARATYWYEFYYDVVLKGRYTFKIKELHEQYGPIIRVNPDEVHFHDPDFYDAIYAGSTRRRDRGSWFYRTFNLDDSMIAALRHDEHRAKRAPMSPYFSTSKVRSLQPRIESHIETLLKKFEVYKASGRALPLDTACFALSNDIVMDYAFGRCYNRVAAKDFDPDFHLSSAKDSNSFHCLKHLPWIMSIMGCFSEETLRTNLPELTESLRLRDDIKEQVIETQEQFKSSSESLGSTTIFHELLRNDPDATRHTFSSLWQDGVSAVLGGTKTTATTMFTTVFHLLQNQSCLKQVRQELAGVFTQEDHVRLARLESLPYLTAVIKEGLRMSGTVTTRLARLNPDNVTTFVDRYKKKGKTYLLPPRTPMQMTVLLIHNDPSMYPEPEVFRPERWLTQKGNVPPPDKYFVPFTKGARICIGLNLAYAEIYLFLAHLFRPNAYGSAGASMSGDRGFLELFETTYQDIEVVGDALGPMYRDDSRGVRILVKPAAPGT